MNKPVARSEANTVLYIQIIHALPFFFFFFSFFKTVGHVTQMSQSRQFPAIRYASTPPIGSLASFFLIPRPQAKEVRRLQDGVITLACGEPLGANKCATLWPPRSFLVVIHVLVGIVVVVQGSKRPLSWPRSLCSRANVTWDDMVTATETVL